MSISPSQPPAAPTAWVVGAAERLGEAVVRELIGRGARAVAHVPASSPDGDAWRGRLAALGAEVDDSAWERAALARAMAAPPRTPTHVLVLAGASGPLRPLLEACRDLPTPPRFVLLSLRRSRRREEEAVRASGLTYSIARAPLVRGPGEGLRQAALRLAAALLRRLGWSKQAARYAPTDAAELAYGLVHAAFNYTTIGRVLMPEELRYELANDREYHVPATRRDELRH